MVARKVLYTPHAIIKKHEESRGKVIETLKKLDRPLTPTKVKHTPEAIYLSIGSFNFEFEESTNRLIVKE